jgi:phosphatidylglycerophosphate synthase
MTLTTAQPAAQHVREHFSVLANSERRALIWIAGRLPARINSDHLSTLALLSMLAAGISFASFRMTPWAALAVIVSLVANWFGDSLDGTVARVRDQQRPRYGYYVDHVIDLAGTAMLFAGVAASGLMSPGIATLVVAAYYLVSAEAFLATHSRGLFKMAFAGVGPTELRLLLAAGAIAVIDSPFVSPFGLAPVKLWDLGGVIAVVGMVVAFVVSSSRNGFALYLEETRR